MPFVAVCPHCRGSRFRAPSKKRGTFTTCNKCQKDFLLVPDGAAGPVEYVVPPFEDEITSDREHGWRNQSSASLDTIELLEPTAAVADPVAVTEPAPVAESPLPVVIPSAPPPTATDIPLRFALIAFGLFGGAVLAAQFPYPYGVFVGVPLFVVGLLLGVGSVLGLEHRQSLGWAATGLNLVGVVLLLAWPDWLGASGFKPSADPESLPKPVTAVGRDGSMPMPADWVDAHAAVWEQGDVRVTITGVTVVAIDPAKKNDRFVRIGVKLTNVGVARMIEFPGWTAGPPEMAPKLTTAGGVTLALRPMAAESARVLPGKSAETTLAFAYAGPPSELRLELSPAPFGGTDPVRFRLPKTMLPAK